MYYTAGDKYIRNINKTICTSLNEKYIHIYVYNIHMYVYI